ncbi:flagellar hook-basal body complex protein FliE [Frigidibacter sp. ROC022]|uniref:flagellar hook-basal body complex protein FliE n=1 Tax=Frigidibacter sp. ROC022 TaxID=2971796 RepID=UPI00215AF460|nr:flagellar hook-basal body complex protein FliE [Frigidibacter sp. ROC022]MCR8724369.1 flagellar hook-basal body complex protein FliE [Frigidibacter sp. ROC022]
MDIRSSFAAQGYAATRPATAPKPAPGGTGGTETAGQAFARVAEDFAATMENGDKTARAALTGRADSHSLVQALAQTELAIETAVAVRNKVVEAYQEILRMPV